MGGCIEEMVFATGVSLVSSLYGRVYRGADTLTDSFERFLPIWEGVSSPLINHTFSDKFPPYMGGCIVVTEKTQDGERVSSLYGRVYQDAFIYTSANVCFLPIWEGVSAQKDSYDALAQFPPYMGGCIVLI